MRVCNEEQLLAGARRMDRATLARIHDCFFEMIYRYARYRTDDIQLAEDAASEVFARLLDALHEGRPPHSSLRGWLFATASHVVNDHYRRRYRVEQENIDDWTSEPAGDKSNPEVQLDRRADRRSVRAALRKLTPEQQHVLALRFGQELSHKEVAGLVGKSEGAVKLLQLRGLRSLRRLLEEDEGAG
jgi:RNA polymerase sigma-70 factor (ECF subfamily)